MVSWGASVGRHWTHGTTSHVSGSSGAGQVPYVTVSGLSCSHLKLKHNPWIKDRLQQRSNLRFLRCWSSISHPSLQDTAVYSVGDLAVGLPLTRSRIMGKRDLAIKALNFDAKSGGNVRLIRDGISFCNPPFLSWTIFNFRILRSNDNIERCRCFFGICFFVF